MDKSTSEEKSSPKKSAEDAKKAAAETKKAAEEAKKAADIAEELELAQFKSSRRMSIMNTAKDSESEKKTTNRVSESLGINMSDPTEGDEITSKMFGGIIPEVTPLSESELKFSDDDSEPEASETKVNGLGYLSDDELRKRKLLLQEKLKGLEEDDTSESKSAKKSNGEENLDKSGSIEDEEEDEKSLRMAAQLSMEEKALKKKEAKESSNSPTDEAPSKRNRPEDEESSDEKAGKRRKKSTDSRRETEGMHLFGKKCLYTSGLGLVILHSNKIILFLIFNRVPFCYICL